MNKDQAKAMQQMAKARAIEMGTPETIQGELALSLGVDGENRPAGVLVLKNNVRLGRIWYHGGSGQPVWLQSQHDPLLIQETLAAISEIMASFDEIVADLIAKTYDAPSADDAPLLATAAIAERDMPRKKARQS